VLVDDGHTFGLNAPINGNAGAQIAIGIRPEHLHRGDGHDIRLPLTVGFVEQLGADTVVHGTLNGGSEALSVRFSGVQMPETGSTIELGCAAENLHMFDMATGQRLG
jgi:sn-glycerol 3-phosphate transport system ATP-binding protein